MKIIVLTSKFGMGHYSAARTLAQQIQREAPHHQTLLVDFYQLAFPQHYQTIYHSYTKLMLHGGKIVNSANRNITNEHQGLPRALKLPEQFFLHRLGAYLAQERPDIVITTYSFASYLVAAYQRSSGATFSHITCITDVGIHNIWINPGIELYLAACADTKRALLERGVNAAAVAVSGIPVDPAFHPRHSAGRRTTKELLIMGGGLGMLPEAKSFYRALGEIPQLHTTVVCAKNSKLQERLSALASSRLTVTGCIDDVPQRMAAADLLLTKPGGISSFEAIRSELPLLFFPPVLEQEIKNCNFMLRNGLAKCLSGGLAGYAGQIEFLLHNELRLADIRHAMHLFCKSLDSDAVMEFIMAKEGRMPERRAG